VRSFDLIDSKRLYLVCAFIFNEHMLREHYLNEDNIAQKTQEWLDKLRKYTRDFEKHSLATCALLVIDMQNYFLDEQSHAFVPSAKTIVATIKELITAFREYNHPIIFTRFSLDEEDEGMMITWWNDTVKEGSEESKIIAEFTLEKDSIIRKKKYSAFRETELNSMLRRKGIETIVITGVLTHLCCDTTARDAFMHDFDVLFVVDSTASYNEELHLSSLVALSHGFVTPTCSGDIIEKIRGC
jgi:isochorismate hydrolase